MPGPVSARTSSRSFLGGLPGGGERQEQRKRKADPGQGLAAAHWGVSVGWFRAGRGAERGERGLVIPVSEVDLAALPAVAGGRPGEARSVGGGDRQTVEAVRGGDPDRLLLAGDVHHVHLEVAESQLVGGEQDVLEGGVDVRRPAHGTEVRELTLIAPVRVHGPDVRDQSVLRKAPPDDPRPVGEVERAAVVAGNVGQAPLFAAVGAHGPDLAEVRRIDFGEPGLPLRQFVLEHAPHRGEDDPFAVRRPASLGVVALRVGEADEFSVRAPFHEDVHVGVVIPLVAALLAALPELDLLLLEFD